VALAATLGACVFGVLLTSVLPGSNAARAGLHAGDVLLAVGAQLVESSDDLASALEQVPATITFWRDGQRLKARLSAAPLGAVVDPRSARAAVRAWRRQQEAVAMRGTGHRRLPGTRLEVQAIAALVKGSTTLLGSDASEQRLDHLRQAGKLKTFRILHFATHGQADNEAPGRSALILAQDRLPDPLEQVRQNRHPYDGRLTVARIRAEWQLDADLVVLSACQTALGKEAGGDGLLGFAQAFLHKGARSVVLSRWKVDDTATALLMVRFYENLLGKRPGLKQALGRAEALAEAKKWLAGLKRKEAGELAVRLSGGVLRGTEAEARPLVKGERPKLPAGERPFEHPYYWAAFVLIGDPS
jgi:CHAT domain-containing protein